jgi:hypothetical protein
MEELAERDRCYEPQAQNGMGPPYIGIDGKGPARVRPEKTYPVTDK